MRVISRSTAATSTGTKRNHISGALTSVPGGRTRVSPDDTELLVSITEALGTAGEKRNNEMIVEKMKGILQVRKQSVSCFTHEVVSVCSGVCSQLVVFTKWCGSSYEIYMAPGVKL